MNANDLWRQRQVPNGPRQYLATVVVLQYLETHYHHYHTHKARVLAILAARQQTPRGE